MCVCVYRGRTVAYHIHQRNQNLLSLFCVVDFVVVVFRCVEIMEFTSDDETAVCNLASIAFPMYVEIDPVTLKSFFNFKKLYEIVYHVAVCLDKGIDVNYYPFKQCQNSNFNNRPISIGGQGLADTYLKLRLPAEHPEARKLNKTIAETMLFAALNASKDRSIHAGKLVGQDVGLPYPSFRKNGGAPLAQEHPLFHWELNKKKKVELSGIWDWEALRQEIKIHGVRNSLLIGFMPTAGTAQLLKNSEGAELRTSNMFVREVKKGAFACPSRFLQDDLIELGLWNDEMKDEIFAYRGSIQFIDRIPDEIKALHKTIYEVILHTHNSCACFVCSMVMTVANVVYVCFVVCA